MGAEKIIPLIGILGVGGLAAHYYSRMDVETNTSPLRNTSFGQPTPQQTAEIEAVKAEAIAQYKENNEEPIDTWSEYLPSKPYGPEYFENFMDDEFEEDNPFTVVGRIIKGSHDWPTTRKLKLIDWDRPRKTSGGLKLIVKEDFQVLLKISTNNAGYFHDDVSEEGSSTTTLYEYSNALGKNAKKGTWFWTSTKSTATVPLVGDMKDAPSDWNGDYLSVDIDSEHTGIRAFRVVTLGRRFSDNGWKPNDNVYVEIMQINRRNPNYNSSLFSAESYSLNAVTSVKNAGKLAKLWGRVSNAVSAINPLKKFSKVGGAAIDGSNLVKGQKLYDKSGNLVGGTETAYKLTSSMLNKPANLIGVKSFDKATGLSKLEKGFEVVRYGKVIKGSKKGGKGLYKLTKGDEIVKIGDVGASGGSGFGNILNVRNGIRTVGVATTVATVYVIGSVAQLMPGLVGEGVEDFTCSLTGSCCEEQCGESDNPDCVAECQEAADDKAVKFGGLVVVGILGLVVILKGSKSKKSAEEYYVVKEV
tara:strand:+ start:3273 stop:4859 length:1587 start_codon:yes stop_codon:yes gene_type:complete